MGCFFVYLPALVHTYTHPPTHTHTLALFKHAMPEDANGVALLQALDMMPSIKNAVGNLFPIFMDGGIRRGTDMLKVPPLPIPALHHAWLHHVSIMTQLPSS